VVRSWQAFGLAKSLQVRTILENNEIIEILERGKIRFLCPLTFKHVVYAQHSVMFCKLHMTID